jgi:hypothetical protein
MLHFVALPFSPLSYASHVLFTSFVPLTFLPIYQSHICIFFSSHQMMYDEGNDYYPDDNNDNQYNDGDGEPMLEDDAFATTTQQQPAADAEEATANATTTTTTASSAAAAAATGSAERLSLSLRPTSSRYSDPADTNNTSTNTTTSSSSGSKGKGRALTDFEMATQPLPAPDPKGGQLYPLIPDHQLTSNHLSAYLLLTARLILSTSIHPPIHLSIYASTAPRTCSPAPTSATCCCSTS